VFGEEMGAKLHCREPGIDSDLFDPYCEHLLVRDETSNEIVGTYRILPPTQARKVGSFYSETEFDLTRLQHIRSSMVEIGRSCVHPDYRTGATIALLWSGLADYMTRNGYEYLIGCASISMADGGHMAASIFRQLEQKALSPVEWRVFPRCPLPLEALNAQVEAPLPPLIKGYLKAGVYICGEPAWDPDFNTADVFVLLPMSRMTARYARHFLST
jgi:putative hemolysin